MAIVIDLGRAQPIILNEYQLMWWRTVRIAGRDPYLLGGGRTGVAGLLTAGRGPLFIFGPLFFPGIGFMINESAEGNPNC
jgi:hypothetical protein